MAWAVPEKGIFLCDWELMSCVPFMYLYQDVQSVKVGHDLATQLFAYVNQLVHGFFFLLLNCLHMSDIYGC